MQAKKKYCNFSFVQLDLPSHFLHALRVKLKTLVKGDTRNHESGKINPSSGNDPIASCRFLLNAHLFEIHYSPPIYCTYK